MNIFKQEKGFYKTLIKIALPTIGAHLMANALGLADTFMVGQLGENAVAAAALANRYVFISSLITFGFVSGGSVLAAQYWGKKDIKSIEQILAIVLKFSLIAGAVFSLGAFAFPAAIMRVFTDVPEVVSMGATYLRIISPNFIIYGLTNVYPNFLRNVECPNLSLTVNIAAFFVDLALNAIFIFGLFGFPAMGLSGAALSTTMSVTLGLIITMIHIKWFSPGIRIRVKEIIHSNKILVKDFFHYSGFVMVNEMLWGIGIALHDVVFGHMSASAVAAGSIVFSVQGIISVLGWGTASAGGVLIGKAIGKGEMEKAKSQSALIYVLSLIIGVVVSGGLLITRQWVVTGTLFAMSDETLTLARQMMLVWVFLAPFSSCNGTTIVGILRAGGDTRTAALFDLIFMWGLCLPLAFAGAFYWNLSPIIVMMLLRADEIIKFICASLRVFNWKWMRNLTRGSRSC